MLTRFYPRRAQAIKDENDRKSIEKLAEQMYSALQEKGNRKKHDETE